MKREAYLSWIIRYLRRRGYEQTLIRWVMAYSEGLGQRLEMEGRVNKTTKATYSILHKNGVVVLECNTPGQLLRSSDHEMRSSCYDRPKGTASLRVGVEYGHLLISPTSLVWC